MMERSTQSSNLFGSLWRSEDMSLIMLTMQREAAHDSVEMLGELNLVEFRDLNENLSAFQRQYANEVKRCDELERKLRFFSTELSKTSIKHATLSISSRKEGADSIDSLETLFDNYENELKELSNNLEQMQSSYNNTSELLNVLQRGNDFFQLGPKDDIQSSSSASSDTAASLLDPNLPVNQQQNTQQRQGGLGYITGVINTDKKNTFTLLLYRATRGNMLPRFSEIDELLTDPSSGNKVQKSVFIVFFSAERAREKIKKICESLGAHIHPYPEGDVQQEIHRLSETKNELENTIQTTQSRRQDILSEISVSIDKWRLKVAREKAVYHVLNMFDHKTSQHSVIAQAWCPSKNLDRVRNCLKDAERSSGAQVESYCERIDTDEVHPTYFEVNKFTYCYQNIVEAYGVARYKEVNPTVLTIITFPFLFAVMFGDMGHGTMLLMFAILLIALEKKVGNKPMNELVQMVFDGRYVLLLMGMFSIFTGLLYNDVFSLVLNLFGSAYTFPDGSPEGVKNHHWTYPIGVDPAWYGTSNKLNYYNSLKMKTSVIFGIVQMTAGLFLSLFNHIYFRHYVDAVFEFVPELILLLFTFGYMSFLIILKWCIPGADPNLLSTMTGYFLSPNPIRMEEPQLYPYQPAIQFVLLIIAGLQIPLLLFPKPIIEFIQHKNAKNKMKYIEHNEETHAIDGDDHHITQAGHGGHGHEDFNFGEAFIKQIIHTIEFALGCVSNTASYLRLWALSLAHAELSEVFFSMTIDLVLELEIPYLAPILDYSGIGMMIAFLVWFMATLAVLMGMESLSAFLHALRLHWVEFQSKFYGGDGKKFLPFNFKNVLNREE